MVIKCTCTHAEQDKIHGKGNRVHNYAAKANGGFGGYRCTVCLNVKSAKSVEQK